jgi:hypothetical protein
VEHAETYHGQRILVTTLREGDGWTFRTELLDDDGRRTPLETPARDSYPSEDGARRAGLSAAAEVIDARRISRGKP